MQDWFLNVRLINTNKKISIELKTKYYKEILEYRTLLRNSFKEYIHSNDSLSNLIETSNKILFENEVHPQIIIKNDSHILEYITNSSNYNELLVKIVIEFIKLVSSIEFKYLKKCDNHKCSLYFIDTSRNHSRRWCSMEICGNRSKVNSFSKRKKELASKT